jgi:DNA polymerase (family 10)/putative hydrolase
MANSLRYKNWMKYKPYLLSGEWHIHTSYTDGNNSINEYCREALKRGIPLLVFSEHVRRTLDYDFKKFLEDIELARREYPELIILAGCEAKVLETGELDVSGEIVEQCEVVLMAFHSFPANLDKYYEALITVLTNPIVDIWAHPGFFLSRNNLKLMRNQLEQITEIVSKKNILIELNSKYNMPPKEWLDMLKGKVNFVRGNDIHSLEDFKRSWKII